jgi:heat shock protein HspQ
MDGKNPQLSNLAGERELIDTMPIVRSAKFAVGDIVRHRLFDFRGVIYDIDPIFANSEAWYEAIPIDIRPPKDQPFYHLLAENSENSYVAYVSQQKLVPDDSEIPVSHPSIEQLFHKDSNGGYQLRSRH